MLTKIKKLFILILLILLGVYLLFPFLAKTIVNSNLPPESGIQIFDIGYPSFTQISIPQIRLNKGGFIINIEDMILDYHLDNIISDSLFIEKIAIKKVTIKQEPNQEIASDDTFQLPRFKTDDIAKLKIIKNINIQQIDIYYNNKLVKLMAVEVTNLDTEKVSISFATDNFLEKNHETLHFASTFQLNQNKITLDLEQANNQLFNMAYIIDDQQITLTAEINIENVYALLPKHWVNSNYDIEAKGIVSFELKQESQSNDIDVSAHIEGESGKSIHYTSTAGSGNTSAIKFSIDSEINLHYQNQWLIHHISQYELSASKLNILDSEKLYYLKADDYKVTGSFGNILSTLSNIKDSNWVLSGLFTSPKIQIRNEQDDISINAQSELMFNLIKDEMMLTDGQLSLSGMTVSHPKLLLNSKLSAKWKGIDPKLSQGTVSLELESDSGQVLDLNYDKLTIKNDINLLNTQFIGEGKLLINDQLLTSYSFVYTNKTNELTMKLKKTQLDSQLIDYYLDVIGQENNVSFNIVDGEFSHFGSLSMTDKVQADSEFEIKNMLFQFGDNTIEGFNLKQKLISIEPLSLQAKLDIDSLVFASGLTINNIKGIIESQADNVIEFNEFEGEIWEGKLKAKKISLRDNNIEHSSIALKNISLTELIFFMDIPGLYGEGKIQFNLPLTLKEGVVSLQEGTFKTTEDGILKYSSGQTQSKEDENIALKALDNFHYKSLDGTISYNELGEYHIKLHLLGANPDLYDGYPIDFILNLNGELSGVFRSLFLTGNFEEAVMEQVKSTQTDQ